MGDLEDESQGVIQTGPFGSQLHASDYRDVGTPVVMPTNIRDMRVEPEGIARIAAEDVERLARHKLRTGDVVYSRRGDVEKCALITPEQEGWLCGTGCLLVRVAGATVDARCLAYALSTPETRAWISQHAVGATMLNLNTQVLREVPVHLPPIEEQRAIAAMLGALDDKIESNRRGRKLALQLARAMFTKACIRANDEALGDVATLVLGGTPDRKRPGYWTGGSIPWINSGAANQDIVLEPTQYITVEALDRSAAKLMPAGATVLAITGATLGQVALLGAEMSGNQSLVGVWADRESLTAWLHFAIAARMPDLMNTATGAAQQHVNKGNVAELQVPILGDAALQEWSAIALPLMRKAVQAESESRLLVALRDTLLPELLSRRLKVADAREVAEALS